MPTPASRSSTCGAIPSPHALSRGKSCLSSSSIDRVGSVANVFNAAAVFVGPVFIMIRSHTFDSVVVLGSACAIMGRVMGSLCSALAVFSVDDMKLLMVLALLGLSVSAFVEDGRIEWHQCRLNAADDEGVALDKAGAECGELQEPLDYWWPDGPKITLALSRLWAFGDRIGAMVLNDGGLGGLGLSMLLWLWPVMKVVGMRYDLIGLDSRFVGRSMPIDCKFLYAAWLWVGGVDWVSFDWVFAQVADVVWRCGANAGQYLWYVNTRNTARDIDQVWVALGERKISYFGYLYGMYFGLVYL